jgi:hypothetical protein
MAAPRTTDPLWSTIGTTREGMERNAPEGYIPRVEIELMAGERLEPAVVQEIPPWLFFEVADPSERESDKPGPAHRVIAVLREHIAKVEIRYVRAEGKQAPGFRIEPPPVDEAPLST